MRNFFSSRPIGTALGLVAIYFLVLAGPAVFSSKAFGGDPTRAANKVPVDQLTTEFFLAGSVVAIVFFLGWGRSARLTSRPAWGGLWYVLAPTMIILGLLGFGVLTAKQNNADLTAVLSSGLVQQVLALVILVGIFEEVLFRGIVLRGFEARIGPVFALFFSSFIFGIMNYVNWISGQELAATHPQVIHAGLSGLLYGAIALRTRSVWPGVFVHALWDFTVAANGAFLGDAFGSAGQDVESGGVFAMVLGFGLRYFEPILGIFILLGWFRWQKSIAK